MEIKELLEEFKLDMEINLFSEKSSFLRYTGESRNKGLLFRKSVLDVYVAVNEDITLNKSYKNTNVIRNQLKVASKDADENRII